MASLTTCCGLLLAALKERRHNKLRNLAVGLVGLHDTDQAVHRVVYIYLPVSIAPHLRWHRHCPGQVGFNKEPGQDADDMNSCLPGSEQKQ